MHILKTCKKSDRELIEELKSRSFLDRGIEPEVRRIVEGVERHGDGAVASYTLEFDGVRLRTGEFTVKKESIDQARRQVGRRFASVLREIERNLVSYHRRQKPTDWRMDVGNGSSVGERWLPLRRVGLYVPAGKAPLVSTVLMGVVPAKVAGVKEIVVCSPPTRDGEIDPHILAACAMLGVKEVYRIGGAQAIAAMAIGTETIPRVDKIFGPGSVYVTMAKKILYGRVGIDIVAGPSEILILADESAEPAFIAADLLSQAEHGTRREVCVLVTDCDALAEKVRRELERIADGGSRTADSEIRNPKSEIPNVREESSRKDAKTQRKAQRGEGAQGVGREKLLSSIIIVITKNQAEAIEFANDFASEHVEVMVRRASSVARRIKNAGAVFVGRYSPVPIGDFYAGPNHVLPTGGAAKFLSGLSVVDFMKRVSVVSYTKKSLRSALPAVVKMAEVEGLEGHAEAVRIRFRQIAD